MTNARVHVLRVLLVAVSLSTPLLAQTSSTSVSDDKLKEADEALRVLSQFAEAVTAHLAIEDLDKAPPLVVSIERGEGADSIVRQLSAGAKPNARERTSRITALHAAARIGNAEIVKVLLADGADPNLRAGDGSTPLLLVADGPDQTKDLIGGLLAKANLKGPLRTTTNTNRAEALRMLLEAGAEFDVKSSPLNKTIRDLIEFAAEEMNPADLNEFRGAVFGALAELVGRAAAYRVQKGDFRGVQLAAHGFSMETIPSVKQSYAVSAAIASHVAGNTSEAGRWFATAASVCPNSAASVRIVQILSVCGDGGWNPAVQDAVLSLGRDLQSTSKVDAKVAGAALAVAASGIIADPAAIVQNISAPFRDTVTRLSNSGDRSAILEMEDLQSGIRRVDQAARAFANRGYDESFEQFYRAAFEMDGPDAKQKDLFGWMQLGAASARLRAGHADAADHYAGLGLTKACDPVLRSRLESLRALAREIRGTALDSGVKVEECAGKQTFMMGVDAAGEFVRTQIWIANLRGMMPHYNYSPSWTGTYR